MSKKGILIIPVEISNGSSGCGGLIFFGILIYLFVSNVLFDKPQSGPVTPVEYVESTTLSTMGNPHSEAVTNNSVSVSYGSGYVETYLVIPKNPPRTIRWYVNQELGIIVFTQHGLDQEGHAHAVNQSGLIGEVTLPMGFWPSTVSIDTHSFTPNRDDLITSYTDLAHLANATNTPPVEYEVQRIGQVDVDNREYFDSLVINIINHRDDRCEARSIRSTDFRTNGFILEDLRINQTGYYAAYDQDTIRLWDWSCNEIFRFQTNHVVWIGVTNEGGVLAIRETPEEYLVIYIKV